MAHLTDRDRLQALHTSGLLRKDVAGRFDHLVYSASVLLDTDLAQLNVLTDELQYHVSTFPPGDKSIFPVQEAGCRLVVESERVVMVEDTFLHPAMCRMSWAQQLRGYLGAPVFYDQQCVGSLCVLTVEPRTWTTIDELSIKGLAMLAGQSLD